MGWQDLIRGSLDLKDLYLKEHSLVLGTVLPLLSQGGNCCAQRQEEGAGAASPPGAEVGGAGMPGHGARCDVKVSASLDGMGGDRGPSSIPGGTGARASMSWCWPAQPWPPRVP